MSASQPQGVSSSVVHNARHGDPATRAQAIELIFVAHWKPLYKYIRFQHRLPHDAARSITLNFLTQLEEPLFFAEFDWTKEPAREFIRRKIDGYLPTPEAASPTPEIPAIDFPGADAEFTAEQVPEGTSGKEYYTNEWIRNIFTLAVEELYRRLLAESRSTDFELFLKLDLQDRSGDQRISIEAAAADLSMPMTEAWSALAKTRQQFQNILIDLIRSFTSSEAEFRREVQSFIRT